MDNPYYEDEQDMGVYIPSVKSELAWSMNLDYCPRWLLNEIDWLQFEGFLEHTYFHAKGDSIPFHSLFQVFHMFSIRICKDGG